MLRKIFIVSIFLFFTSGVYTVLAPESKANTGSFGILISGSIIIVIGLVWFLSGVSRFIRQMINVQPSPQIDEKKYRTFLSRFLNLINNLFLYGFGAIVLFALFYIFVAQSNTIDGDNMAPAVVNGERVLTNKFVYRIREPRFGEIIIFHSPQDERFDAVSRIIAIPGDRIKIVEGDVILNGQKLNEPYLPEANSTVSGKFIGEDNEKTLGINEYFVMSDKRSTTNDSRSYGYVKRESIVGKIK